MNAAFPAAIDAALLGTGFLAGFAVPPPAWAEANETMDNVPATASTAARHDFTTRDITSESPQL
jgi:hypothetical protein